MTDPTAPDIPPDGIRVLDKGYVRLVDHMGNDLSVVNAARASFDKEVDFEPDGSLATRDQRLLNYLYNKKEMSVFRQATVQFEIYMPLMVARQYWKYIVGVANVQDGICLNESSRRYITEVPTFYIPEATEWRGTPEDKKQGSSEPIDPRIGEVATQELMEYVSTGEDLYSRWLKIGIAPEQARLFLPAYGMYVRCRTTMSLAAFIHFLEERLGHTAQFEIYSYAVAMKDLVKPIFPNTFEMLENNNGI